MEAEGPATVIEKIRECCRREEAIIAAYLFGSAVTGRMGAISDIDVAVLVATEHEDDFPSLAFAAALDRECGRPVDLVLLNRAGELLKYQVRRYGRLVFERDSRMRKQFEVGSRKRFEDFLYLHKRYIRKVL
jgi:uncharacterized protein